MIFLPMLGFAVAQLVVSGVLISAVMGFEYKFCVFIVAALAISYVVLGGMWSIVLTNFIQSVSQSFVIIIRMSIIFPAAVIHVGVLKNILNVMSQKKFFY